jgi:hypothetical protein
MKTKDLARQEPCRQLRGHGQGRGPRWDGQKPKGFQRNGIQQIEWLPLHGHRDRLRQHIANNGWRIRALAQNAICARRMLVIAIVQQSSNETGDECQQDGEHQ